MDKQRADPDTLLKHVQSEEDASRRGKLKLFFGAAPGVGKTYAMLEAARQRKKDGIDVILGVVETHKRAETQALLEGLEVLPRKTINYKGVPLQEFDLDAALKRNPALILVDELAHTNAPGSRHNKRWQDVEELLNAGINVYTTLNVQHWESLNDVVSQITGVVIRETVPDSFLNRAADVKLVDLPPEELLQRLRDGKVYLGEQAERAAQNFFTPGNLIALRELALRHTAQRVDAQIQAFKEAHSISQVWQVNDRLLVCISASPLSVRLVRATFRMASRLRAEWIVAYVETAESPPSGSADRNRVVETLRLAGQLGAETITLSGHDVAEELLSYARARNVTRIILGKPAQPRWREILRGSLVDRIARRAGDIDLHIISGVGSSLSARRPNPAAKPVAWQGYLMGTGVTVLITLVCGALFRHIYPANLLMLYLLGVAWIAFRFGRGPSLFTSFLTVLAFDFFFIPPYFSFAVADTQFLITFAVMLGVGYLISHLTTETRAQAESLRQREFRTRALYRLSRALSETPDPNAILPLAWTQLQEFYKMPILLLVRDQAGMRVAAGDAAAFGLTPESMGASDWVFLHGEPAGMGTDTLTGVHGLFIPLKGLQGPVGVLAIQPPDPNFFKDPEQLRLIETAAGEIGGALESTQMSAEAGRAEAQIETERLRNLILSSFSYEMREPLAKIQRLTQQLISQPKLDDLSRHAIQNIEQEAAQLEKAAQDIPDLLELKAKRPASEA